MLLLTPFMAVLLLGIGDAVAIGKRSASVFDKGDHTLVCNQQPIELGIILDSSRSIRPSAYLKAKQFLHNFLEKFDIGNGRNDIRVSIILFGRGIYPDASFNLTTYETKAGVLNAILNLPHKRGGRTDTGDAIEYMHTVQLTNAIVRPWAEKVAIVLTDGNSQKRRYTKTTAEHARASNIKMFAVGVGNVNDLELLAIAGSMDRVIKVKNFDSLDSIKTDLLKQTCIKKIKPTTTLPPKTICGEVNPADVNFVFSPADLGLTSTAWATSFISNVVDGEDMDIGFRYGVVSGSCPDDSGFALNKYDNVPAIKERLLGYDKFRIPSLVKRAGEEAFSAANGGRGDARDVAVLFAKEGKGQKDGALEAQVKALTDKGVKVFVANPSGNPVDVKGAVSLLGESSRMQSEDFISRLCPDL